MPCRPADQVVDPVARVHGLVPAHRVRAWVVRAPRPVAPSAGPVGQAVASSDPAASVLVLAAQVAVASVVVAAAQAVAASHPAPGDPRAQRAVARSGAAVRHSGVPAGGGGTWRSSSRSR